MKKFFNENKKMIWIVGTLIILTIIFGLAVYSYRENKKYRIAKENEYNKAFYELVDNVQNVETYLAKAIISTSPEHGVETLTNVWREAGIAQSCLSQLPLTSSQLGNTSKFLNQISDYSYSLSRKNMDGESLTQDDLNNIKELHKYSVDLENTLNQLSTDLNDGRIKWSDLTNTDIVSYATQVSSITSDSFSSLEENFHEYSGLIYDGAFSDHMTSAEKKGLTGDDIDENRARDIAKDFFGRDNVEEITSITFSENADIPSFDMNIKLKGDNTATMSVSRKGGHIIFSNYNKLVNAETISQEKADEIGKEFLINHGYTDMKETYYLKENGIVTINYAYKQVTENGEEVTIYPDLIKLKIALDDGSVLGIETTGYLNCHTIRDVSQVEITREKAKEQLNKELQIESEGLAIIPTEWKTEILCWEFKGKVEDNEFLVYVNAKTGEEEDILVIVNTPNGTLTH